jgi:AraC-like DNA-binding protein
MKVTPIQYLTQIRIRVSVQLLITSELSVSEIANQVGFRSSNYFSKVFKKLIGVTPGSYRKYNKVMPVDKLFID